MSTIGARLNVLAASLRQCAGSDGKLGSHRRILRDPVGESIFAVLDYGFASFITIIRCACLARRHGSVVNQFEQVLPVSGDDGHLLAVLAQSIELVCVGGLDLLARYVRELSFGHERLGFGSDEFLFEDDDSGRVWLLVFQLGDLVCDFLLALKGVSAYTETCARWWDAHDLYSAVPRPQCS
ncbi:unnamed protein product [Discula destructiva]